jgi:alpha-L-fucosidase
VRSVEGTVYTLEFENPVCFNRASLRETIAHGQRIDAFALEAWVNDAWVELARGQSIGSRRLLRFPATTTRRVRLRVLQAAAPPELSEFALYHAAE